MIECQIIEKGYETKTVRHRIDSDSDVCYGIGIDDPNSKNYFFAECKLSLHKSDVKWLFIWNIFTDLFTDLFL